MQMILGGGILTDDMCNFEKVALNDQVEKRGPIKRISVRWLHLLL